MVSGPVVVAISIAYLLVLFAIAWYGDRRAAQGRSLIANPTTYALSIAVFCTSWTFYGSVGRAASGGLAFLPIYLGPTLVVALSGVIIGKMVHIGRTHRITSIADFISARYGKSPVLGGVVTIIAVLGIMPYISLQLKAVSTTLTALLEWPHTNLPMSNIPVLGDTVLLVAIFLAAFAILFGTRHIDAAEHHEGMVLAIAFESVVKLVAFLAVGIFVTYGLYDGFADIFLKAADNPDLRALFTISGGGYGDWVALVILSMLAFTCLPRQFQVTVVENVDRRHVDKAVWLFPLYLLAINIFVLPVALAGRMTFAGQDIIPDLYVLALPLTHGATGLAVLVFLGGLSAAASMVIVETIALSTMVCNDLVMPLLLRLRWLGLAQRSDLSGLLLTIRRGTIAAVVLLGYAYVRLIGDSYALVTIGLVSFCAAAQFAPALIGGILWKGATEKGALAGLLSGFAVWTYTLLLPSFARSGWLPVAFAEQGLAGIELLKPYALFGLSGLEPVTHALVWSMLANVGAYVSVSLLTGHTAMERIQASLFVDALRPSAPHRGRSRFWRGTAAISELKALCVRFVGPDNAERAFTQWAEHRGIDLDKLTEADSELVDMAETLLAGAIGAASARVMVASVSKGEVVGLDEVMEILDEASQVIAYSQRLEAATAELKAANERLTELDRMKDDFISTVTHELRTPLTSIRSFSEILFDNPGIDEAQRLEFLAIIIKESERLTRLINQVLDMAKMESGRMTWHFVMVEPRQLIQDSIAATGALFEDRRVTLETRLADDLPPLRTDADKFMQVVINLLSNAVKFVEAGQGRVRLTLAATALGIRVEVADNGPGLPANALEAVFDKFHQVGDTLTNKPKGTGLGLAISRTIVEHLGGRIWVDSIEGQGATFTFELPNQPPEANAG
ncbi:putative ATP-binding region, ATPase-like:Histidine kinase [Magnetospirillum gryphiswaldense MSR-1 v2]|uniref:histidine kinase n=1 Tax=Magnetospirillum gryphiswaldense (strain DSM 6361 / JCM 21280 / NBRC 15271 / MSR-1) TaxID=431944 RepID=V6F4R3_MAGGM|nr:ATP-binding protein [Magnetospirillum gryphiswaldense]CDK99271.1 putative ATP-binding region, ATPase-like:Histidine kinase [Magnetospirillum gryphiswaldense MSR-1 v2]